MGILPVSGNRAISLSHIVKASYSKSKISVPVSLSSIGYARFKHIKGIPSFSENSGFSVTKLKQLDTMIDFISRLKNEPVSVDFSGEDPSVLESLSEQYSKIVREQLVSPLSGYQAGSMYSPGSLLNATA